jgi:inosine/guanosine/xanthosine phosphorylase family protein
VPVCDDYPAFADLAQQRRPRLALILGSGLGALADRLHDVHELPFHRVPDLDQPTIPGHRGSLLLGECAGRAVLVFAGRLHAYEGHPWRRVLRPVHVARELGAEMLLVTNAAGGIRADLNPGDVMAIHDHLDWTRPDGWKPAPPRPSPYAPLLLAHLRQAATRLGMALPDGVYAQVTGPSYETRAEIRALRAAGADAVGMSTVREVEAGCAQGLECAALSCITNKAAGLGTGPVHHEEVLATASASRAALTALVEAFLEAMPCSKPVLDPGRGRRD